VATARARRFLTCGQRPRVTLIDSDTTQSAAAAAARITAAWHLTASAVDRTTAENGSPPAVCRL